MTSRARTTDRTLSIDRVLPSHDFSERHHIDVAASPERCFDAARRLDFSDSPIITTLFHVRGLRHGALSIDAMTADGGFTVAADEPPVEFVLVHEMQRRHGRDRVAPSGRVQIAWNFRTEEVGAGRTRLHTETRVRCDAGSKRRFGLYWWLVRPFSGLVRREMLRLARAAAEATEPADPGRAGPA